MSENACHWSWTKYVRFKEELVDDYEDAIRTVAGVPKILQGLEALEDPLNADRTEIPVGPRRYRRRR